MSMKRCIPELQGQNKLSRDQAERAQSLYEDLERDYSTKFGKQAADAMASEEAVRRLEAEAANKKRQAALQITAQQTIAADVRRFSKDSPGAAAEALLASDDRAPYFNVEFRAKAIANEHFAMMNGILDKHSRNVVGQVRDVATLHDVVREAFGENSGNAAARELADAWLDTAESLRLRFNASGGAIGKLDKWGMPQVHNMLAVRASSFEEWRDFIRPLLDPQRMLDETGNPMTPGQMELALRGTYETIASDGWNDRRAGAFAGGKLGNRHQDSRFLIFKDADSWLSYAQKYGRPMSKLSDSIDPGGAILDAMISHVHGMSRDIALMQRLGPNPAATMRWVTDGLMIEAAQLKHKGTARRDRAEGSIARIQNMYQELSGGPLIENRKLATIGSGIRAWQSAAKLGGAVISSLSDIATQIVTRRFNGLPAVRVIADTVGQLRPSSKADREHAARQLFVAERTIRTMSSFHRMSQEAMTGEIPARLSDMVMQLSYLGKWTDDGHKLFNHQVWAGITDNRNLSWDSLKKKGTLFNPTHRFRRMLERYGLGEQDWDTIRSAPLTESGGAHWILPESLPQHLSQRLSELILAESNMAVPTSSLRVNAAMNARLHKGSAVGELGRAVLQFKGFPIQLFYMHGRRALASGAGGALEYAATLYIASTLMGAVSLQLKQVIGGKDPLDMTDPQFWIKASFQGGGLGIVGDFVNAATSRLGKDFWTTMLGPQAGAIDDIRQVGTAGYQDYTKGTHKTPDALRRLIQNNLPGSTLWYAKLAVQRTIMDQLQAEIDPDYYDSFDRMEKRARQDGTQYYWRPGQRAPDRAPDLANATGSR
jgi:hypothetical protein